MKTNSKIKIKPEGEGAGKNKVDVKTEKLLIRVRGAFKKRIKKRQQGQWPAKKGGCSEPH